MAKSKQRRQPGGRGGGTEEASPRTRKSPPAGADLKDLDDFIEKVLEEAGEEFLDEFRQIEGE